jgi:hypothetical protein
VRINDRAVASVAGLLALTSAVFASQAAERTMMAVVRSDGFIVPIAEFRDGRWTNDDAQPWGEAGGTVEPPLAWFLRHGAPPTAWRHSGVAGAQATIRTTRAVVVENHCQKIWALESDVPGTPLRRNEHHRNLGLAVTAGAVVQGFDDVGSDSDLAQRALTALTPILDREEDAEIARLDTRWPTGMPAPATRRAQRPVIESIHRARTTIDGRVLFHARLVRTIRDREAPYDRCSQSILNAWVASDAAGVGAIAAAPLEAISTQYILDGCASDAKMSVRVTPLGVVVLAGRTFAAATEHGYEGEQYALLEMVVRTLRRVLVVEGGGC